MTTVAEEVEAAELEGFFEVGHVPQLAGLYWAYKTQRAAAAAANKIKGRIADKILEALKEHSATVFTIAGQPVMRRQVIEDKLVFDQKKFEKEHPVLFAQYKTKTKKGSIKVWVRPQNGDDISEDGDDPED